MLFLDEFQTAIEFSGPDLGVAGQLKPVLARGEIACIGAMTEGDYHRLVGGDSAFERRFEPVRVELAFGVLTTLEVLRSIAPSLSDEPVDDRRLGDRGLSAQYLRTRQFPDKAIDVLDRTLGRARRLGVPPSAGLAADVVGAMTGLPLVRGARSRRAGGRSWGLPPQSRGRAGRGGTGVHRAPRT